eukprot:g3165.t1
MSAFQRRVNRGQRQHLPDSASQFSSYQSVSAAVHQANNKAPVQPIRMDEVDRIIAQLNSDEAQNPKPERLEDALLDDQPPSVYAPSSTPSNQSRVADEKRDAGPRTANSTEIRMISQAFMDSLRGQPAKSVAVPYLKNNSMFSQEDFNSEVKYNDCYRTRTGPIEGRYKKWLPICTSGDIQAAADRLWRTRKETQYYLHLAWKLDSQLRSSVGSYRYDVNEQTLNPTEILKHIEHQLSATLNNPAALHESELLYAARNTPHFLASVLLQIPGQNVKLFSNFVINRLYQNGTRKCNVLCAEFVKCVIITSSMYQRPSESMEKSTVPDISARVKHVLADYALRPEHVSCLRRIWANPLEHIYTRMKRGGVPSESISDGTLLQDVIKFYQLFVNSHTLSKLPDGIALVAHTLHASSLFSTSAAADFLFQSFAGNALKHRLFAPYIQLVLPGGQARSSAQDADSGQSFYRIKNYFFNCGNVFLSIFQSGMSSPEVDFNSMMQEMVIADGQFEDIFEKNTIVAKLVDGAKKLRGTLLNPGRYFSDSVVARGGKLNINESSVISDIGEEIGARHVDIITCSNFEVQHFVECMQLVKPPTRAFPSPFAFPVRGLDLSKLTSPLSPDHGGGVNPSHTFMFALKPLLLQGNHARRLDTIHANLKSLFLALSDHDIGADEEISDIMTMLKVEKSFMETVQSDYKAMNRSIVEAENCLFLAKDQHEALRRRLLQANKLKTAKAPRARVQDDKQVNNLHNEKMLRASLRPNLKTHTEVFSPSVPKYRIQLKMTSPVYAKRYSLWMGNEMKWNSVEPNKTPPPEWHVSRANSPAPALSDSKAGKGARRGTSRSPPEELSHTITTKSLPREARRARRISILHSEENHTNTTLRPKGWHSSKAAARMKKMYDEKEAKLKEECTFQPDLNATRRSQHTQMGLKDELFPTKTWDKHESRGARVLNKERHRKMPIEKPKPSSKKSEGFGFGTSSPRFSEGRKSVRSPAVVSSWENHGPRKSKKDDAPVFDENASSEEEGFSDCEEDEESKTDRHIDEMSLIVFPVPLLTRAQFLKAFDVVAQNAGTNRCISGVQLIYHVASNPVVAALFTTPVVTGSIPVVPIVVKLKSGENEQIFAHFSSDIETLVLEFCTKHELSLSSYQNILTMKILSHLSGEFPDKKSTFFILVKIVMKMMQQDATKMFSFDEFISHLEPSCIFYGEEKEIQKDAPKVMLAERLSRMHHGDKFLMFHVQNEEARMAPFELRLSTNNSRVTKSRTEGKFHAPVYLFSVSDIERLVPLLPKRLAQALSNDTDHVGVVKPWLCFTLTVSDYLSGKRKTFFFQADCVDTLDRWVDSLRDLTDTFRAEHATSNKQPRIAPKGKFLWARVRQRVQCDAKMRRKTFSDVVVNAMLADSKNIQKLRQRKTMEFIESLKGEIPFEPDEHTHARVLAKGELYKKGRGGGIFKRKNWLKRSMVLSLYLPTDVPVHLAEVLPYAELNYSSNGQIRGSVRIDHTSVLLRNTSHPATRFTIQRSIAGQKLKNFDTHRYDIELKSENEKEIVRWRRKIRQVMKICRLYSEDEG